MEKVNENGVDTTVNTESVITNSHLVELNVCFQQLLNVAENMNGKFIYALHKNMTSLKPHIDALNASRTHCITKYAKLDSKGNPKTKKDESGKKAFIYEKGDEQKALEEFQGILAEPVDITFHKVDTETFYSVENLNPKTIASLGLFIDLIVND